MATGQSREPAAPRGMTLDKVVPWGRSLREYRGMFALADGDLRGRRVLDCAGGPASFACEAAALGAWCVAADPIYVYTAAQIDRRIRETHAVVVGKLHASREGYHWDEVGSPENVGKIRMAAMRRFLDDYRSPTGASRYVASLLPALPFADDSFDLALSSHLLFTYAAILGGGFHLPAIRELLRVAREVRLFPLVHLDGAPCLFLEDLLEDLRRDGCSCEVRPSDYRMQKGADSHLVVRREGGRP